jgi:hypothetical protein
MRVEREVPLGIVAGLAFLLTPVGSSCAIVRSILAVDSPGEVLGDIRTLIFVDGESDTLWIAKRIARPVRNLERAAFHSPAASVQGSDSALEVLDTINQDGGVPLEMSGEQNKRSACR